MIVNDTDPRFAVQYSSCYGLCPNPLKKIAVVPSFFVLEAMYPSTPVQLQVSTWGKCPGSTLSRVSSTVSEESILKLYFIWCLEWSWSFSFLCIFLNRRLCGSLFTFDKVRKGWEGKKASRHQGEKESVAILVVASVLKILFTWNLNMQLNLYTL